MVKIVPFAAASLAVLAVSVSAHGDEDHSSTSGSSAEHAEAVGECNSTISAFVTSVYTNGTFFSTCAAGSTFKITTLADTSALSETDFFAFCNSSTCLGPVHEVIHEAPTTCLITYDGKAQNLTGAIVDLHDKCHEVKDAAKAASSAGHSHSHSSGSASAATVTTPAPTTGSSASVNSKVLAFALAGCATVASFLL